MQPIKDPYSSSCSHILSSSCIKWSTDLVLNSVVLEKNQSLTEVIINLVTELNDLQNSLDVSSIDLQCLTECSAIIDCSDNPPLTDIIECLIKSHCELKGRVDSTKGGLVYSDVVFDCAHVWSITDKLTGTPTDAELYSYLVSLICEVYDRTKNDVINTNLNALTLRVLSLETTTGGGGTGGGGTGGTVSTVAPGCSAIWSVTSEIPNAVTLLANRLKALEQLVLNTDRGSNIINCDPPTLDPGDTACMVSITTKFNDWGYDPPFTDYDTIEDKFKAMLKINCALIDRMSTIYDNITTCCEGEDLCFAATLEESCCDC